MKIKNLIIQLLIEDMKHEQLISGLKNLGFVSEFYGSDLCAVVAELMGIPEENISWDWMDIYMSFIRKAVHYEITDNGKSLLTLAETCYTFLKSYAEKETLS